VTASAGASAKLFVWAGIAIKTFGTKRIEEVRIVRRKMQKIKPPIPGKVGHLFLSSVSGRRILIDFNQNMDWQNYPRLAELF
jgi:hypothetical protein